MNIKKFFINQRFTAFKEKVGPYFKKSVYYLLDFAASLWLGVLCMVLLNIPIKLMIKENYLIDRLLVIILDTVGIITGIMVASAKEGYRVRKFEVKKVLIAVICVFVVHNLISPFLNYAIYVGGPASTVAEAIQFGNNPKFYADTVSPLLIHLCMVGIDFILLPLFFLGEYLSVSLRNMHNKQLREHKFDPKAKDEYV